MEESMIRQILELPKVEAGEYSSLALAYIGDAVYEVVIRTKVMSQGNMQVHKMHTNSAALVKAPAQAAMIRLLMEELSPEEETVYRRGRNAKSGTMAKHATMTEYRMATGFEALLGYLYLTGRSGRLLELVGNGLKKMGDCHEV